MRDYMKKDDLGVPESLSFQGSGDAEKLAADVKYLEDHWGDSRGSIGRAEWQRAWRNARALACQLLRGADSFGKCDPQAFHHLLLAIGNFKRQAGTIHLPVDLPGHGANQQCEGFELPGGFGRLECHDPASWARLAEIPGLGIPTATCLLAALWPANHVIMDIYDRRAAVGLQVGRRSGLDPRLDRASIPKDSWWVYNWFRQTVKLTAETADCEPLQVERALYLVGARTNRKLGNGRNWTWSDYRRIALHQATA